MTSDQRKTVLKIAAMGIVGLFLLDRLVITPATQSWIDQSDRIAALNKKVTRGESLLERESSIRGRWSTMLRANLPNDNSVAEYNAYRAFGRWVAESGVISNSLTPQWQNHDDGYETFELRVTATGDQISLGKFVYLLETDPLPVNLDECEIVTRDVHGSQLTMTMRCTFARLSAASGSGNSVSTSNSGRNRP